MKRIVAAVAASVLLWAQPAVAQQVLRDAETELLFAEMATPLVKASGLSPRDVKVVLINDESINAFVAGGQTVYVHSGTIQNADSANEVQGVIAHELGHVADGHVVLQDAGATAYGAPVDVTDTMRSAAGFPPNACSSTT